MCVIMGYVCVLQVCIVYTHIFYLYSPIYIYHLCIYLRIYVSTYCSIFLSIIYHSIYLYLLSIIYHLSIYISSRTWTNTTHTLCFLETIFMAIFFLGYKTSMYLYMILSKQNLWVFNYFSCSLKGNHFVPKNV